MVAVPEVIEPMTYGALVDGLGELFKRAKRKVATAINETIVLTYWRMGKYIVEYEQHGADRAKYGSELLKTLSFDLRARFGRGFNRNNLQYMRKLYRAFPKCTTLSCKLTWSHYLEILKADDEIEIGFYCAECVRSGWDVRELRRQMKAMLFHRVALSKDKAAVLRLSNEGSVIQRPEDVFRDRYVLEFTGIGPRSKYSEADLHDALVNRIKNFLLELGKGFSFVASEYRIPLNVEHPYHVDLVFYNYFLHCFVLIDLKRNKVDHYDVGQMNLYLNYFKSEEGTELENAPIGIILAADKDDLTVEFATQGITNRIFVSRYQLYLPDKEQLRQELARAMEEESRLAKSKKRGKISRKAKTTKHRSEDRT